MRVWPALPTPGELVRLALPCPPQLVELSGYEGTGRLIAMWWSPWGDELMISDGSLTATGHWRGWLCFCEHPLVRLFLEPYRLGDSDDEGELDLPRFAGHCSAWVDSLVVVVAVVVVDVGNSKSFQHAVDVFARAGAREAGCCCSSNSTGLSIPRVECRRRGL